MNWDEILPLEQARTVEADVLEFDSENPRFTPDKRPDDSSDEAIIRLLDKSADLGELVQSIAFNGYINIEPLIVYAAGDKLTVLEGNRRLAALKCLRDPDLAARCKVAVPVLSDYAASTLDRVLVFRVADHDGAKNLIGFKHINGPQTWDAYAKALYALHWLDAERRKEDGISLLEIAKRMGDKHDTLRRMVTAAYVIRQAEAEELWSIDDRKKKSFSFSHLYTALSYPEFTNYVGMARPKRDEDPIERPVPETKYTELRRLLLWIYGSKSEDLEPVVENQARDLNRLKQVLGSTSATRELTERGRLADAVVTATPKAELFATNLVDATASLKVALETVTGYDPETQPDLIEFAKLSFERADTILGAMERKITKAAQD